MGDDGRIYCTKIISEKIKDRRNNLIAKWKAKGCSDNKINELIQRRINSKRQYW